MTTSSNTAREIGMKLKRLRTERHMTQSEVADKAKLHVNYYAKIERANLTPSIEAYERIAKALNVKAKDIFPF